MTDDDLMQWNGVIQLLGKDGFSVSASRSFTMKGSYARTILYSASADEKALRDCTVSKIWRISSIGIIGSEFDVLLSHKHYPLYKDIQVLAEKSKQLGLGQKKLYSP